ncbi:MAG TPA: bifunctional diguanylate cyclase/phosphodiesterase [Terracidiphilus sp.]|nr:bifunctional diguanylate cyclase/phosphodiesterase [Terracidiphilus sp.]
MPITDFDPVKRSDVLVKSRRRVAQRNSDRLGLTVTASTDLLPSPSFQLPNQVAEDELRRQMLAYAQRHDLQTGLLNYQAFQESIGWLLREDLQGQEVALLWIDVLNLRREFSLWGSAGTDALVRHIADALRSAAEPDAVLGRFSGRCFLIAMRGVKYEHRTRKRFQSLINAIQPMRYCGTEIKPELAGGVAFYPSDAASSEDLVRFASLAAGRAAHTRSQTVVSFNAGMNSLILHDHRLELEMRKGLEQGQFSLAYQPMVDLATGRIAGAEALMRWNHPEWGKVAPNDFIPVAERSDLIHRVFDFSLRAALADTEAWRALGIAPSLMSVNVSAANMRAEGFIDHVRRVLGEFTIAPTELEIEVTESLLFEDEELFATRVRQLKAIGVRVGIDDFGTRYTGFNLLKQLPLDTMKIDKCFIRGVHRSSDMRALCETIVAMAKQMKLQTVAEGIEESGELEVAHEIGCNAGQGYLFRRPISRAEFAELLQEWPERAPDFAPAIPAPPAPAPTDL